MSRFKAAFTLASKIWLFFLCLHYVPFSLTPHSFTLSCNIQVRSSLGGRKCNMRCWCRSRPCYYYFICTLAIDYSLAAIVPRTTCKILQVYCSCIFFSSQGIWVILSSQRVIVPCKKTTQSLLDIATLPQRKIQYR